MHAMVATLDWNRWKKSKIDEGRSSRFEYWIMIGDHIAVMWYLSYALYLNSFAMRTQILLILEKYMKLLIACWVK